MNYTNYFGSIAKKELVTLSGVPCVIQQIDTPDKQDFQRAIERGGTNGEKAIIRLVHKCLVSIGDNDAPDELFVRKMLPEDVNHLLFEIRQLTYSDDLREIQINYRNTDQAIKKNEEIRTIQINRELFPSRPFKWVLKEKARIEEEARNNGDDAPFAEGEWPILYTNYEEMYNANKNQVLTLRNGMKILFVLPTQGKADGESSLSVAKQRDASTNFLMLHNVQMLIPEKMEGDKPVYPDDLTSCERKTMNFANKKEVTGLPSWVTDDIMEGIRKVLGQQESMVHITSLTGNDETFLNILTQPAFFHPGLAR